MESIVASFGEPSKALAYGTAGFRDRHDLPLDFVFVRMGVLAGLRAISMNGICVGAVITASHNLEPDNGVKLVDFNGGMLDQQWEPLAVKLVNCTNATFGAEYSNIVQHHSLADTTCSRSGVVLIGRDTRPHSAKFYHCMQTGALLVDGTLCCDLGEVTTPLLHFAVRDMNQDEYYNKKTEPFSAAYYTGRYYHTMAEGYRMMVQTATNNSASAFNGRIVVDASYGVGSIVLAQFAEHYNRLRAESALVYPELSIDVRNKAREGKVNEDCGAEHAQKLQLPPVGVDAVADCGKLMCSFDGDGDRIVFHAFLPGPDGKPKWVLLDGDKIACLVTIVLHQELSTAGLLDFFSMAVVQTAYANGASTQFIRSLGVPIHMAKTGVKFLHHTAQEFDVGVYFEANGHGTVLFSDRFVSQINAYMPAGGDGVNRVDLAFARLQASIRLINPAVGDALSDMLYAMAALQVLDMDLQKWHELYTDLPSKQQKVGVPDKSMVACSEDECMVVRPVALQEDLEIAMRSVNQGRCFVRPSGTEDVVRIYAEAATQAEADVLTELSYAAIRKHLG